MDPINELLSSIGKEWNAETRAYNWSDACRPVVNWDGIIVELIIDGDNPWNLRFDGECYRP